MPLDRALEAKLARLEARLAELRSVVVAFSGGVDSTLLLRVASLTPTLRYIALTTDSPTNTQEEIDEARRLAAAFGAPHHVIAVNELDTPGYAANPANRCYLCKQTLYPLCRELAREHRLAHVVDGVNSDDLGDYRPGLLAAREHRVVHPLVDAGLDKLEVRHLSRHFRLPTAERPASPCLSSRFPYGTEITRERLTQVARAEARLRELGFVELRVRHLGNAARVEVAAAELARLHQPSIGGEIRASLCALGFVEVMLSSSPLRSGSLNDVLSTTTAGA